MQPHTPPRPLISQNNLHLFCFHTWNHPKSTCPLLRSKSSPLNCLHRHLYLQLHFNWWEFTITLLNTLPIHCSLTAPRLLPSHPPHYITLQTPSLFHHYKCLLLEQAALPGPPQLHPLLSSLLLIFFLPVLCMEDPAASRERGDRMEGCCREARQEREGCI